MKINIRHKLEYVVLVVASLMLILAFRQTIMGYFVSGEYPYTISGKSTGIGYTVDDISRINEIKASIRETQEYFFYIGPEGSEKKEYASLESIMESHPLGFEYANAGPVTYVKVVEPLDLRLMISSESNNSSDIIAFEVETLEGEMVYSYSQSNTSFQDELLLEPGEYFISMGSKTDDSDYGLAFKFELSRH